jgi:hypothetical protein
MGSLWYASKENVVACQVMALGECHDINDDAALAASRTVLDLCGGRLAER